MNPQWDLITVVCIIAFLHCVLFFFHTVFKSCCVYPYVTFLKKAGLDVNLMVVKCFTTILNRPLQKWGIWRPRFLQLWFSIGVFTTMLLLPFSVYIVLRSPFLEMMRKTAPDDVSTSIILEPIIPGYNLPVSELGYYALTLLVCTFVHEVGHAVAAVREDVHIIGTGFFLLFMFPAACVYVDTNHVSSLAPLRKLRILCAGVWHNVVLSIYAVLLLYSLPWIVQPFYTTGDGVYVLRIEPESAVLGPTGLRPYDVVTALNDCPITDSSSWRKCLYNSLKNPTPGYCVSAEFVRENDESIPEHPIVGGGVECCSKESSVLGRLCFQLVDDSGGPVELPEHSCLSARELIESGNGHCAAQSLTSCSSHLHCLRPTVANYTKLVTVRRSKGDVVLFLGNPAEIYQTVRVTDFVPRWNVYDPLIPQIMESLAKYMYMMSSGLAVVNVLPVFFFDGQHIASALCDLLLSKYVKDANKRLVISLCACVLGSLLLLLCVLTPLATLVMH